MKRITAQDIKPGFKVVRRPLGTTNKELLALVEKCILSLAATVPYRFTDKRVRCLVKPSSLFPTRAIDITLYIERDGRLDQVDWMIKANSETDLWHIDPRTKDGFRMGFSFFANLQWSVEDGDAYGTFPRPQQCDFELVKGFNETDTLAGIINFLMVFIGAQKVGFIGNDPVLGLVNARN